MVYKNNLVHDMFPFKVNARLTTGLKCPPLTSQNPEANTAMVNPVVIDIWRILGLVLPIFNPAPHTIMIYRHETNISASTAFHVFMEKSSSSPIIFLKFIFSKGIIKRSNKAKNVLAI